MHFFTKTSSTYLSLLPDMSIKKYFCFSDQEQAPKLCGIVFCECDWSNIFKRQGISVSWAFGDQVWLTCAVSWTIYFPDFRERPCAMNWTKIIRHKPSKSVCNFEKTTLFVTADWYSVMSFIDWFVHFGKVTYLFQQILIFSLQIKVKYKKVFIRIKNAK